MKKCITCKIEKDESEYYKENRNRSGLMGRCASCQREYIRRWNEENSEKSKKIKNKYAIRHPGRIRAVGRLNRAIRDGKIKRLPCEKCGLNFTHAHHEDYRKPYDVKWLCPAHHKETHKELNNLSRL